MSFTQKRFSISIVAIFGAKEIFGFEFAASLHWPDSVATFGLWRWGRHFT